MQVHVHVHWIFVYIPFTNDIFPYMLNPHYSLWLILYFFPGVFFSLQTAVSVMPSGLKTGKHLSYYFCVWTKKYRKTLLIALNKEWWSSLNYIHIQQMADNELSNLIHCSTLICLAVHFHNDKFPKLLRNVQYHCHIMIVLVISLFTFVWRGLSWLWFYWSWLVSRESSFNMMSKVHPNPKCECETIIAWLEYGHLSVLLVYPKHELYM
jgi:hypothetical protein